MVTQDFQQFAILAVARQGREAAGRLMSADVSFNLCGDAIVQAPMDAGRAFLSSGIGAPKKGNFIVEK
jgi:predicted NodU family carbamoyl transferase